MWKSLSSILYRWWSREQTHKHTKRCPEGASQHRVWYPTHDDEHDPPGYLALRFCKQISENIRPPASPGLWPKGIKHIPFNAKEIFKAVKIMRSGWPESLEDICSFPQCLLQFQAFSGFSHLGYRSFCTFFLLYKFMVWPLPTVLTGTMFSTSWCFSYCNFLYAHSDKYKKTKYCHSLNCFKPFYPSVTTLYANMGFLFFTL